MSEDSLRLFFAIPLAEELRDAATELQRRLSEARGDVRVKWVERPNLHMTLKFMGDTPAERLDEVQAIAGAVGAGCRPCEVEYRGVGCFASRGCPRTIWLGAARQCPELAELARSLEDALAQAGLAEPEGRAFQVHATLGRVRDSRGGGRLMDEIRALADAPVGSQRIEDFVLISSELTGRGPIYTERGRFRLGG
ncbi:MAG TPA: RNA 2',3'-cyclic phosphodiesterase [Armatimonadota bacterium]|nr:RNA 2',3'-cyclic phosphodiesterase [Armatimonadota bacterium]